MQLHHLAKKWLFTSLCLCIALPEFAQKIFNPQNLQIEWRVDEPQDITNRQFRSTFTFTNVGKVPLPVADWAIYFNYIRDIAPLSVTENVRIEPINGDIVRIVPKVGFRGLAPKQSFTVSFLSSELFHNISDAPAGLYWQQGNQTPQSISKYRVTLPTLDQVGYVSPVQIFEKNQGIKDVPIDKLPPFVPTPLSYQKGTGSVALKATVEIVADPLFAKEATFLAENLAKVFPIKPNVVTQSTGGQTITITRKALGAEAYSLQTNAEGVALQAATPQGAFYGIQSLLALMPVEAWKAPQAIVTLPEVTIEDAPRFKFRSLMLDVARNFQQPDELKKVIDLMAAYKLNVLHLHAIDDEGWRIAIPDLPELTDIGAKRGHTLDSKSLLPASFGAGPTGNNSGSGFYSRETFIELLRYAHARHITVIPEIESPGHARAAIKAMDARYEKYKAAGNIAEAERYWLKDPNDKSVYSTAQRWNDNVICVAKPSVYRFMEKVIDEIMAMYREAEAPLQTIHLGGDEVPQGVWEQSPICQQLIKDDPSLNNTDDLWYYYYGKINTILKKRGLYLSGWEEIAMRKTKLKGEKTMIPNPVFANENFHVNVWNNMIGWGAEDLPYRLANAGYQVILSCVSNMYFDLAYQKNAEEMGYYWGGFVDIDKPFYFIPYDYYKNATEDRRGNPIAQSYFTGKDRLTDYGKSNIVGIQGLLWSENIHNPQQLEYLLLPKLLGLAERAWAKDPDWANADEKSYPDLYQYAWSMFVNTVAKQELPRLDYLAGGFQYRIPTVGLKVESDKVIANVQFPNLVIRYTTDGSEPTPQSAIYTGPIPVNYAVKMRAFNQLGRGGRTVGLLK